MDFERGFKYLMNLVARRRELGVGVPNTVALKTETQINALSGTVVDLNDGSADGHRSQPYARTVGANTVTFTIPTAVSPNDFLDRQKEAGSGSTGLYSGDFPIGDWLLSTDSNGDMVVIPTTPVTFFGTRLDSASFSTTDFTITVYQGTTTTVQTFSYNCAFDDASYGYAGYEVTSGIGISKVVISGMNGGSFQPVAISKMQIG